MAEVSDDRDDRRLLKRYRIVFKPPTDQWPPKYGKTFQEIRKIRDQRFDNFGTDNTMSSEQPWRTQIKSRAQWLAGRSARLLKQDRNEEGWRLALENDVLHRFRVEVAW